MLELGGKIEISSRENDGTTVTLRFPKNSTK
jgi:chemotaxis protein histidine kinase CheA